ncbi:E3 SUMO-protein ligase MMS21-like [Zingiber officinale]|uniref:E3 SUMO-protein ligase MMS21-like n=1 Tax=Zingiber officinale TaxID=94328 RepID=UPI001C4BA4FF|nr:E3 SUMO-protein ligase MMS21-like [Zingiber officinale]
MGAEFQGRKIAGQKTQESAETARFFTFSASSSSHEVAAVNVHHAGQPMPGEEQEDIVITSTQNNLLNMKCPLTGKPVTELPNPVHCRMDCKHIYEKEPVIHYISTKKPHPRCPVAGCPKILQVGRVVCDALLTIEIDEMLLASATNINSTMAIYWLCLLEQVSR